MPVSTSAPAKAMMGASKESPAEKSRGETAGEQHCNKGKGSSKQPSHVKGLGPMWKARRPAGQLQAFHSRTATRPAGGRRSTPRPSPPRRGAARSSEEGGAPGRVQPAWQCQGGSGPRWAESFPPPRTPRNTVTQDKLWEGPPQICHQAQRC